MVGSLALFTTMACTGGEKDLTEETGDCGLTWYADADADGWGDDATIEVGCEPPGADWTDSPGDCNDGDANVNPDAGEICNSIDDDCNGTADDGAPGSAEYFPDVDSDGYGDSDAGIWSCGPVSGTVATSGDCDDLDAGIHPDATEICDGIDQDCDGVPDDGAPGDESFYIDSDGDGFGDVDAAAIPSCVAPSGYAADATDCDDDDAAVHPGADETCNDTDDDCNGRIDDHPIDGDIHYTDSDYDGYGDPDSPVSACGPAFGLSENDQDCDDDDATQNPAGTEVCNNDDDDCNGMVDDGATDFSDFYDDFDSDGYGDPATLVTACTAPSGYISDGTDCDDTSPWVFPGADERCNGADDDCDLDIDEDAVDESTWYPDLDSDGYGENDAALLACFAPTDYLAIDGDCNDSDPAVNPLATEICADGIDNDCDGSIGSCTGISGELGPDDADTVFWGDSSGYDGVGLSVTSPGDVDGNGTPDILIGADGSTPYSSTGGGAYLILTPVTSGGAVDIDAADARLYGADDEAAGWSIAGAGDVDDDGHDDLLVGAPYGALGGRNAGTVYLIHGPVTGEAWLADIADATYAGAASDTAGTTVANAGDIDGDGQEDMLVGAAGGATAYLWYAPPLTGDNDLEDATVAFTDEWGDDDMVDTVAPIGDIDGDGVDDLGIGARGYPYIWGYGCLNIWYGTPTDVEVSILYTDFQVCGYSGEDYAASSFANVGDIDLDGLPDLLVGAPGAAHTAISPPLEGGAAYLIPGGSHSGYNEDLEAHSIGWWRGESADNQAGFSVAGAGDVNGDGVPDLLVGAPEQDSVGASGGAAYFIDGTAVGGVRYLADSAAVVRGDGASQWLGWSVAGLGDIDGSGTSDIAIGAPGIDEGRTYLFMGGGY